MIWSFKVYTKDVPGKIYVLVDSWTHMWSMCS